ncbi:hypothetical protein ACIQVO_09480 [Streptomyces sp. NPDC101062]|uniref:hypothetical protein n=1 Tax=unclassified Streptomyces TaxID=2593676 RepID=UPI00381CD299
MKSKVQIDIDCVGPRMLTVDQPSAKEALEHTRSRINDTFLQLPAGVDRLRIGWYGLGGVWNAPMGS